MERTPHVAYFCMEFGLHESFPIYSGGLGVLAGDFVKGAKDLGLPLFGMGIRWNRGYCTQLIGADGKPHDEFPEYEYPFLRETGKEVRVRVLGNEVPCKVWTTEHFGSVPLFLIEPIRDQDRWITQRLYQAGTDVRLAQEMLLGIGGMRVLDWLGTPITAYHFNEGHAVFAGIERIAALMETGMSFQDAWRDTRERIVFTTHTPVKAGNEEHAVTDLRRLGACLQLSGAEMREIGGDPFNMTVAGLRLSRIANAVSQIHGETSRRMWRQVDNAAEIIAITNAVHAPTWQADSIRDSVDDTGRLWEAHMQLKRELLTVVKERSGVEIGEDALIMAFARRAAGYKRSDLILSDEGRLRWMFENTPVHLVFSGKAHPDDSSGKQIVARLYEAQSKYPGRVAFLQNYNIEIARYLTRGADVWLNNPIKPMEASGTSGMKAALNGILNLSILDGWWPEGCEHGVNGWAFGDGRRKDTETDLESFYQTLQNEVLPAWNDRARWLGMMQASIRMAQEKFTMGRMLREYFARLYEPQKVGAAG